MSSAQISGAQVLRRQLREMSDRAQDATPVWPRVGGVIAEASREAFNSAGFSITGTPWAPLSPRYLRWKIRNGFDPRILHKTGALRADMTSRPMGKEVYTPSTATFGTSLRSPKGAPYPKFLQGGTRYMPARPFLVVTPEMRDDITTILRDYVVSGRIGDGA